MKKNIPPALESVAPMRLKLALIGSGILVMVMLILTVRTIVGVLCSPASSPAAGQTNTATVVVEPEPPVGEYAEGIETQISPNLSPLAIASSSSNQPLWLTDPEKFVKERRPARIAALQEIQRQHDDYVPYEIREQREKQRKALIEAAKKELIEQAGTSGVPKEALQKLEHSNPIIY